MILWFYDLYTLFLTTSVFQDNDLSAKLNLQFFDILHRIKILDVWLQYCVLLTNWAAAVSQLLSVCVLLIHSKCKIIKFILNFHGKWSENYVIFLRSLR